MQTLTVSELQNISGGISKWFWAGIGAAVVFFASVVYGFIHPNKC